jgi:hypothetical protein
VTLISLKSFHLQMKIQASLQVAAALLSCNAIPTHALGHGVLRRSSTRHTAWRALPATRSDGVESSLTTTTTSALVATGSSVKDSEATPSTPAPPDEPIYGDELSAVKNQILQLSAITDRYSHNRHVLLLSMMSSAFVRRCESMGHRMQFQRIVFTHITVIAHHRRTCTLSPSHACVRPRARAQMRRGQQASPAQREDMEALIAHLQQLAPHEPFSNQDMMGACVPVVKTKTNQAMMSACLPRSAIKMCWVRACACYTSLPQLSTVHCK